jgi:hypothetical protein
VLMASWRFLVLGICSSDLGWVELLADLRQVVRAREQGDFSAAEGPVLVRRGHSQQRVAFAHSSPRTDDYGSGRREYGGRA